jgi:hypothetical protein
MEGRGLRSGPVLGATAHLLDAAPMWDVALAALRRDPLYFVNPEIFWASDETIVCEEGCLSVPDLYDEVERPARVKVRFLDYHGRDQEIEARGMLAVCIQHEMDHLEGTLFIDHLSRLKRDMMIKKLVKARKAAEREAVADPSAQRHKRETHAIGLLGTPLFAVPTLNALVAAGTKSSPSIRSRPLGVAGTSCNLAGTAGGQRTELGAHAGKFESAAAQDEFRAQARCGGGRGLRIDPAESRARRTAARVFQSACLAVAALAGRGADPSRDHGGRRRDRRGGDAHGRGSRHGTGAFDVSHADRRRDDDRRIAGIARARGAALLVETLARLNRGKRRPCLGG